MNILYILVDILTYTFITVAMVDILFRPRFDKTRDGDLLLWYTKPFKKGVRNYFVFYKKK